MRSCGTRKNAAFMTHTVMRGFAPPDFRVSAESETFSAPFPTFSRGFSASAQPVARGEGRNRGQDLRYDLELDLEEAARGKEAAFTVRRETACEECGGRGQKGGRGPSHLLHLRGPGAGAPQPGIFPPGHNLPGLPPAGAGSSPTPALSAGDRAVFTRKKSLPCGYPRGSTTARNCA